MDRLYKGLAFAGPRFSSFPHTTGRRSGNRRRNRSTSGTASSATSACPRAGTVAERGDVERLVLEGNKTFSTRAQGGADLGFRAADGCPPHGPWTEFLAILNRKIVAGYRNSGFPDIRVDVRPDAVKGKLLVILTKGRAIWPAT